MYHQYLSSFIWSVADLLRGDYKQSAYGKIILPFTVFRRLDCVLESTKAAVLAEHEEKKKFGLNADPFLLRKAKQSFYNISPLDMKKLMGDQDHIKKMPSWHIQLRKKSLPFLILDNLRVHHSKAVKAWVAERAEKIELFYLPSYYSPELNSMSVSMLTSSMLSPQRCQHVLKLNLKLQRPRT